MCVSVCVCVCVCVCVFVYVCMCKPQHTTANKCELNIEQLCKEILTYFFPSSQLNHPSTFNVQFPWFTDFAAVVIRDVIPVYFHAINMLPNTETSKKKAKQLKLHTSIFHAMPTKPTPVHQYQTYILRVVHIKILFGNPVPPHTFSLFPTDNNNIHPHNLELCD